MSDQRMLERLHRAERALLRAGWTHSEGAEEWKPLLGPSASPLLDEIASLRSKLESARKALEPLAKIPLWTDTYPDASYNRAMTRGAEITVEMVRAARVLLTDEEGKS